MVVIEEVKQSTASNSPPSKLNIETQINSGASSERREKPQAVATPKFRKAFKSLSRYAEGANTRIRRHSKPWTFPQCRRHLTDILIFFITVAVYSPVFKAGFRGDDDLIIRNNEVLTEKLKKNLKNNYFGYLLTLALGADALAKCIL